MVNNFYIKYCNSHKCIFFSGTCIIDESTLTGESVPILKTSLPYDAKKFDPNDVNKSNIIYSGTKCLEARFYSTHENFPILGLVYKTGYQTIKGRLIRSMLFPRKNTFNFLRESVKFFLWIFLFALFGLIYSIYIFLQYDFTETNEIIISIMSMITVIIPPALPTCMTIGIGFSIIRFLFKKF